MNRLIALFALALVAAFGTDASAQYTNTIMVNPTYRETKQGNAIFRNVFIQGTAKLPDNVILDVGIRAVDDSTYILWVKAPIKSHEWVAELGPWRETFPAGVYVCEAWFEFDKQNDATRASLSEMEEFQKCIKDDPEYEAEYKRENPERYEKLKLAYGRGGQCVSKKQYGCKNLTIGTPQQETQGGEEVRGFLRDRANLARDMIKEIIETNAKYAAPDRPDTLNRETYVAWATEQLTQIQAIDNEINNRLRGSIHVKHRSAHSTLSNAFAALNHFLDASQSLQFGALADEARELNNLLKKGEGKLDMDEKRRVRTIKSDISSAETDKVGAFRLVAEGVVDTLYGPMGLDPAPEKAKLELEKFKTDFGITWED